MTDTIKEKTIMFTLTFKDEVTIKGGNLLIKKWLKPLHKFGVDFRVVTELGDKTFRYHAHGYARCTTPRQYQQVILGLHLWKIKCGFISVSSGSMKQWLQYMTKSLPNSHSMDITSGEFLTKLGSGAQRLTPCGQGAEGAGSDITVEV